MRKFLIDLIKGKRCASNLWEKAAYSLILVFLYFISCIYWFLIKIYHLLYNQGFLKYSTLPVPVIVVGNITAGGTGKTTAVLYLLKWLNKTGYQPVLLSHGYRSSSRERVTVVADNERLVSEPKKGGDEAWMAASKNPGTPVLIGCNRYESAKRALKDFSPDCIISDDGFGDRSFDRDLDIVLIDSLDPFGGGYLLPRGFLREPCQHLRRADIVLLTHTSGVARKRLNRLKVRIKEYNPDAPVFFTLHKPADLKPISKYNNTECRKDLHFLKGKRVFLFCGTGNPYSFKNTVSNLDAVPAGNLEVFSDHHSYSTSDLERIGKLAEFANAEFILTTEKDEVNFPDSEFNISLPIYVLRVELSFNSTDQEEKFQQAVSKKMYLTHNN